MEKKKSRCMVETFAAYFIFQTSALLFGFYHKWGCCWGKNKYFDRDDAQIIPQYENLAKACASLYYG